MMFRRKKKSDKEEKEENQESKEEVSIPEQPQPTEDQSTEKNESEPEINSLKEDPVDETSINRNDNVTSDISEEDLENQDLTGEESIQEETKEGMITKSENDDETFDDSAEDTRAEINRLLLSIVSGFSEYFYEVAEEIYGNRPNQIKFESIRSDRKIGMTGIQLVSVAFSSEFGRAHAGLAVKVHSKKEDVPPVIKRINFLAERIEKYRHLGVSTPKIVFKRDQILVMEGISGESFRKSPVPITEKYRLAGKCLAALCGPESSPVSYQRYRNLEERILSTFKGIVKDNIIATLTDKFSSFPLEERTKYSGSLSFGDFHSGNLLYEINLYKSPILLAHLIDPEFLVFEPVIDRLEDIANFFVHSAIQEYQLKNNLFQITREIRSFLAGYNEILAYDLTTLQHFYPKGDTFNYHLALGILLSILNLMGMEDVTPEYINTQMESRLMLVSLLLESPSILDPDPESQSALTLVQ